HLVDPVGQTGSADSLDTSAVSLAKHRAAEHIVDAQFAACMPYSVHQHMDRRRSRVGEYAQEGCCTYNRCDGRRLTGIEVLYIAGAEVAGMVARHAERESLVQVQRADKTALVSVTLQHAYVRTGRNIP